MKYFWCYRGEPRSFPRHIEITRATGPEEACAAFDVPFPSLYVHALTSPRLQHVADHLAPGEVGVVMVDHMPSSRDWATEKGWR